MSDLVSYSYSPGLESKPAKQFAVVIFLPAEIEMAIAPMREKYDPDINLIAGHLSLVLPFSTAMTLPQVSGLIRESIDTVGAFDVTLETVGDLYPTFPIISWTVQHSPKLHELYLKLHASLQLPLAYKGFFPHVALAKEISEHRVVMIKEKLLEQLHEITFTPSAVDLISPVADGRWLSVRTFVLPKS